MFSHSSHPAHNLCRASVHCYRSSSSSSWIRSPIRQKAAETRPTDIWIRLNYVDAEMEMADEGSRWWDAVCLLLCYKHNKLFLFRLTQGQRKLLNKVMSQTCNNKTCGTSFQPHWPAKKASHHKDVYGQRVSCLLYHCGSHTLGTCEVIRNRRLAIQVFPWFKHTWCNFCL